MLLTRLRPSVTFRPPVARSEAASQRGDGLAHGHIGACNPAAQHVVGHGRQQGLLASNAFGHAQFGISSAAKAALVGANTVKTAAQVLCQASGDHGLRQDAGRVALGDFDNVALGLVIAPAASIEGGASAQRGGHQDGAAVQQSVRGCLQVRLGLGRVGIGLRISTVSIAWITPLLAATSVAMTLDW